MNHPTTDFAVKSARSSKSRTRPRVAAPRRAAASRFAAVAPGGEGRDDMIRRTAYAFYEARGCTDGYALDDWLQAQAQIEQSLGPGLSTA